MKQALALFTIVFFVFSCPALSWAAGKTSNTNKKTSTSKPKAAISLKIGKLGNIKISL